MVTALLKVTGFLLLSRFLSPMLDGLVSFVFVFVLVWLVIAIHELGHYYAGRRIVGIPADDITVIEPYLPRYVALRDGEEWVSPMELPRYQSIYERYDPAGTHVERFVAAGELVQGSVVGPVALLIGFAGFADLAVTLLVVSMLTTAVYVVIDAVATRFRGKPSGDYSVLWQASPRLPVFLLLGFLSVHVVPLLLLS